MSFLVQANGVDLILQVDGGKLIIEDIWTSVADTNAAWSGIDSNDFLLAEDSGFILQEDDLGRIILEESGSSGTWTSISDTNTTWTNIG